MNFNHFDLNLLRVLDAILTQASVSKAADDLHVTQSAVSQSLKKLRDVLGDPLLIKSDGRMILTKKAEELAPEIKRILKETEQILSGFDKFDPKSSNRVFRIRTSEYFECVIAPKLYEKLEQLGSSNLVHLEYLEFDVREAELLNQEVDLIIGLDRYMNLPTRVLDQSFPEDQLVGLVREAFPKNQISSIQEFNRYKHVADSLICKLLDDPNLAQGSGVLVVESYTAIVNLLQLKTDYIAILPLKSAEQLMRFGGVKMISLPKDFPSFRLNMISHSVFEKDVGLAWMRDLVERCYLEILHGGDV